MLDDILSLDDVDSLPGGSPLHPKVLHRIPTYQEAFELHGEDWSGAGESACNL